MIWFINLAGFWMAFITAGLILAVVGTYLLTRINAKFFGCGPVAILLCVSYLFLASLTYVAVPRDYWDPSYDPVALELDAFVADMSPSLSKKIDELEAKEKDASAKIKKLKKLRSQHPDFAEKVSVEVSKWEQLEASIQKALADIHEKTEQALVDYQIDEISGRQKFSKVSEQLQSEAGRVLELAEVLQSSIEKTSPNKKEEVKSLEDLINELE